MKQALLSLTLLFSFCLNAFSQDIVKSDEFRILGPDKAEVGQMVVLSTDVKAESIRWLLGNSTMQFFVPPSDPTYCLFSSGKKGKYIFHAVVANSTPSGVVQLVSTHTVTIGDDIPTPPEPDKPDPDEPDKPDPVTPDVPADRFDNIGQRLQKHLSEKLSANSKKAAPEVAGIYSSVASQMAAGALTSDRVSAKIDQELTARLSNEVRSEIRSVLSPFVTADLTPRWVEWKKLDEGGMHEFIEYLRALSAGIKGVK